jgi:hypothetical protein
MWRLISNTLPTEISKRFGAPIATVRSLDSLAPICRIATDGEQFDLPIPEDEGNYFYLELPSSNAKIVSAVGLTRNWKQEAKAGTYWYSGSRAGAVSIDNSVTFSIKATTFVPPPTEYLYQLDLADWGNIQVTGLISEGMKFFLAADPNNLTHPEWKFEDSILSFQGEDICTPRLGSDLDIFFDITVNSSVCRIKKFHFPNTVKYCDSIEYLGYNYQIADSRFPDIHQFIWSYSDQIAYIFG